VELWVWNRNWNAQFHAHLLHLTLCHCSSTASKLNLLDVSLISMAEAEMGSAAAMLTCLAGLLLLHAAAATGSPWVYSDNPIIPDGTIRITTLGSGSPDVRKEQASRASRTALVPHCTAQAADTTACELWQQAVRNKDQVVYCVNYWYHAADVTM
jgi:hypothetical protein